MEVGRSIPRVDAADKVTGRAKYTDDLCPRPRAGGQDPAQHHCQRLGQVHGYFRRPGPARGSEGTHLF